jgi:hypothetical protein
MDAPNRMTKDEQVDGNRVVLVSCSNRSPQTVTNPELRGGPMSNQSTTSTARQKEAVAALVDLAIQGGLIAHVERKVFLVAAERDPRGFLKLLETNPQAPPLGEQIAMAARQKVTESGGTMPYPSAVRAVGEEFPKLVEAYLAERRNR